MKNFDTLWSQVREHPVRKVAVAVAQDPAVLEAVIRARDENIAESILVGDRRKIHALAEGGGLDLADTPILNVTEHIDAVNEAVSIVSRGEADILMKGHVHTDDFLRGVLHRERGLRTGSIMSHVFIAEVPALERLLFVTDGAMNIAPDLPQKASILLNAVHVANLFGIMRPKVAVLGAVEVVNPAMPATMDAAALSSMASRHQFIPPCIVDGPFALDNAINPDAAALKRIGGPVAGQADILLLPDVEAGNLLAKSLVYFAGHRQIGLLVGASAPVVLTSRADSTESKLLSMAGAVLMVHMKRKLRLKVGKVRF